MSNFQLRRRNTRFRREINSRGGRNKLNEEPEGLDSKLGRKLAAFKAQPDSDLAQQFSLSRSRPLFIGACSRCSIHSGATFFPDSIYNYSALKDALHGNPKEARKVCFPLHRFDEQSLDFCYRSKASISMEPSRMMTLSKLP